VGESFISAIPSPGGDSGLVRVRAPWVSPLVVWQGTRTRTVPTLAIALRPCRRVDAPGRVWDVPVGDVVTTDEGRFPFRHMIYVAEPAGLRRIEFDDAFDLLDPEGAADRAAQRAHDALADAEGLPRELARFVGEHGLANGVHRVGNSAYYAERCTKRQAYWRRASREEVAALAG